VLPSISLMTTPLELISLMMLPLLVFPETLSAAAQQSFGAILTALAGYADAAISWMSPADLEPEAPRNRFLILKLPSPP
jgi:hypothetical protein